MDFKKNTVKIKKFQKTEFSNSSRKSRLCKLASPQTLTKICTIPTKLSKYIGNDPRI